MYNMRNARPMHFRKQRLPERIKLFSLRAKITQALLKIELYVISPLISHSMQATLGQSVPPLSQLYMIFKGASVLIDSKCYLGSPF